METIPYPDRGALYQAMSAYAEDLDIRYTVKRYGDGLLMLKPSNGTSGRCLFFCHEVVDGVDRLVALLFYKKDSDDAPKSVIATAKKRMSDFKAERGGN